MGIKGFQGTSLLDFPGRIASLVFWGGCNLTCPFCHNPSLVLEPEAFPDFDPENLLATLASRKPFIDGVVISGGEPTLDPRLPEVLTCIKALDLAIKIDTNGLAPQIISELIAGGLVDYLAVDLKTLLERYSDLHCGPVDASRLLETITVCRSQNVQVEYRTTCVPGWVDEEMIHAWGNEISGTPIWAIQQYHPEHALDQECRRVQAYPAEQIRHLAEVANQYVQKVIIRGL